MKKSHKSTLYQTSTKGLFLKLSNLFFIISFIIIIVDALESYKHHYDTMVYMEVAVLFAELSSYALYRYAFIHLQAFASSLIVSVSLLVIASQFIIGKNPEFSLFSLATLPIFIFFFLGLKRGTEFTIFIVFILFLSVINSYVKIIEPLIFTSSLHFEVMIGYIGISFLYYQFEKQRQSFESQLITYNRSQKILLKELNHRVKNNLQTIIGLMLMQSKRVQNENCKKVLSSQVNRLKAIGLVHEQLSSDSAETHVDMEEYFRHMINSLQLLTEHKITLNAEKLVLDNATATYLGLFVNEAVSNAIEHAYLSDRGEKINVTFNCENDNCTLIVEDYGQGFGGQETHNSLGLLLMENISDFLENSFMILDFEHGTKVTLEFSITREKESDEEKTLL